MSTALRSRGMTSGGLTYVELESLLEISFHQWQQKQLICWLLSVWVSENLCINLYRSLPLHLDLASEFYLKQSCSNSELLLTSCWQTVSILDKICLVAMKLVLLRFCRTQNCFSILLLLSVAHSSLLTQCFWEIAAFLLSAYVDRVG